MAKGNHEKFDKKYCLLIVIQNIYYCFLSGLLVLSKNNSCLAYMYIYKYIYINPISCV